MFEVTTIQKSGRISRFIYDNYQDAKKAVLLDIAQGLKSSLLPLEIPKIVPAKKDDEPDFSDYHD